MTTIPDGFKITNSDSEQATAAAADLLKAFNNATAFRLAEFSTTATWNNFFAYSRVAPGTGGTGVVAGQYSAMQTLDLSGTDSLAYTHQFSVVQSAMSQPFPNLTTLALPYNAFKVGNTFDAKTIIILYM